jgi:hypothetical protein
MLRLFAGAIVLALAAVPAAAQTNTPNDTNQVTVPPGNSGAGIQGHPGNKSGPTVKKPSETSGAGTNSGADDNKAGQDASKVPGLSGSKSGPAAKSPNSTSK